MYIDNEDKLIAEIMEEFEIPFTRRMINYLHEILYWTHSSFDSIEKFQVLVDYLKERDTKDIYGREQDDPKFTGTMAKDGWLYYLEHYAYYISNIVKGNGIHWMDRDKYLFPTDVYDIIYKHQNARGEIFIKYMEEKYPESMNQMESYNEKLKELGR